MTTPARPALPYAALGLTMLSVQFGAGFAKQLFPVLGVELTTALRLCVGAALLLPVLRPWRTRLTLRALPGVLAFGAVLGAMNLMFYLALQRIPLGIAVALEFTGPLGLAALGSRRPSHLFWVALAAAGVLLLSPIAPVPGSRGLDVTGVLFALGAGLAWALYTLLAQRAGATWGTSIVALAMAAAALMVLPLGAMKAHLPPLTPRLAGSVLLVAVFSAALPYPLEVYALTRMSTRVYGILISLEPAIATLMGLLLLAELPGALQLAGICAVVAASAGTALTADGPYRT